MSCHVMMRLHSHLRAVFWVNRRPSDCVRVSRTVIFFFFYAVLKDMDGRDDPG